MSGLVSYVHVYDDRGEAHAFGPEDELPEWAARSMGAHCFEDGEHPFPDADGDGEADRSPGQEPTRSGKGSGKDAWVAFAREKQFNLDGEPTRDEIIAQLSAAGVIEAQ